ncbi:hypothetical protein [Christiangramia echinicola]|uniref:hypothetical protein n=1 Tax=Christiangramia echinicola TaxID=279359 RepID=UPI00047A8886|nr:hypothetical protein [Christiangramia echinicola]
MQIINRIYTKLVLVYNITQNKDLDISKELAYTAIRNTIGVLLFFSIIFIQSLIDLFITDFRIKRSDFPIYYLYLGLGFIIIGFIYFSKVYLKPNLEYSPNGETKNPKKLKRYFTGYIISIALFGGLMFVILRMLYIYLG